MYENYLNYIEGEKLNVEYKRRRYGSFEIENRNRLSPDYIRIFYVGVFAYTSIPMLIMFLGVLLNGDKISLTPFEIFWYDLR